MKSAHLALGTLLVCSTLTAYAARQIVPAGSLINCTISEAKLSSKTMGIGDPVLCQAGITTRNGSARLPFNTFLEGRFEDYKDPGHFVGKGWMELRFDRMVIEPRTIIPVSARVVDVPGYAVDQQGRILGKGHTTRDIVEWCIPILWPIDLLNLPRRGPRPTLKTETRITVKVMDDTEVPIIEDPDRDPSGLYRREPSAYDDVPQERPQRQTAQDDPPAYQPPPQYSQPQYQQQQYQPPQQSYVPPAPVPAYVVYAAPPPVVYVYAAPPPPPVYMYAPPTVAMYSPPTVAMYSQPGVAMWSQPRTIVYPNTIASAYPYGY